MFIDEDPGTKLTEDGGMVLLDMVHPSPSSRWTLRVSIHHKDMLVPDAPSPTI